VFVGSGVVRCATLKCSTHDFEADNIFGGVGILLHAGKPRPLYHTWVDAVVVCFRPARFRFPREWGHATCISIRLRDLDVCGQLN